MRLTARSRWWATLGASVTMACTEGQHEGERVVDERQALAGTTFNADDGNLDTEGAESDWESFDGAIDCALEIGCGTDPVNSSQDNIFGQGSKDDHVTMTVVNQKPPQSKTDLKRAYVATETVGQNVFLYFAWIRSNTNGSTNFSIELNQTLPTLVGDKLTYERTGARLITWDFEGGGKTVNLAAYRWITDPDGDCEKANSPPCWGDRKNLGEFATASVNQAPFGGATTDPLFDDEDLPAGTFGEAAINMTAAGLLDVCGGIGAVTVRSRASSSFGSELKDFITSFPTAVEVPADVSGANANGIAYGYTLSFTDRGNTVIQVGPEPHVASTQTGPGTSSDSAFLNEIVIPPADIQVGQNQLGQSRTIRKGELFNSGPLAPDSPVKVLQTLAQSAVTQAPPEARQTSRATLLDVNILAGLITADKVTAEVKTVAHPDGAQIEDNGSGISNLKIAGAVKNGSSYSQKYLLPQYGPNSGVEILFASSDSGVSPPPGTPLGTPVTWEVSQEIRAIRVLIEDTNQPAETANLLAEDGDQRLELTIAYAQGQSTLPTILCQAAQEVAGHAFILKAAVPGVAEATHGFVSIPRTGGAATSSLDTLSVGDETAPLVKLSAAKTVSEGGWNATEANAESSAEAGTLCLLSDLLPGVSGCAVEATLTLVKSESMATAGSASATPTFQITSAKVVGNTVPVPVDQETKIDLKVGGFDVGDVVFNERVFDPAAAGHAGVTVRGLRVTLDTGDLGLPLGAELVVLEAHSGATFLPGP